MLKSNIIQQSPRQSKILVQHLFIGILLISWIFHNIIIGSTQYESLLWHISLIICVGLSLLLIWYFLTKIKDLWGLEEYIEFVVIILILLSVTLPIIMFILMTCQRSLIYNWGTKRWFIMQSSHYGAFLDTHYVVVV